MAFYLNLVIKRSFLYCFRVEQKKDKLIFTSDPTETLAGLKLKKKPHPTHSLKFTTRNFCGEKHQISVPSGEWAKL